MFAHGNASQKFCGAVWIWGLRSKFAVFSRKTKDLRLACKSVFQKATSCARRRIAAFLFRAFLCAFCVKEKRSSDAGVKIAVILIIVTFKPDVLFLFLSCEREKEPKREDSLFKDRGISLVATSDKGYAPLTGAHCRGGLALTCANMAVNNNLYDQWICCFFIDKNGIS